MNTDSCKVTWEFVQSTVPYVEREWGVADEIVREFNELDEAQMELKFQRASTRTSLRNSRMRSSVRSPMSTSSSTRRTAVPGLSRTTAFATRTF